MLACSQGRVGTSKEQPPATEPISTSQTDSDNPPINKHNWLAEAQQNLGRWYAFHEKSTTGFKPADFVVLDTFHEVEFIELDITEIDPALSKYRLISPNGKNQLDIYGYGKQLLPDKNGQFELAAQSLESEVALYGVGVGKKLRLLFCGANCQFEDAAWVSNDKLIIAGTTNEVGEKNRPMLWGIQLSTKSVFRFLHPAELPTQPKSFFNTVIVSR